MGNARKTPKDQASAVEQRKDTAALVTVEHGRPMVDSLTVAHEFKKRHDNVLRDLDALKPDLSPEFWRLNFEERNYTDRRGKVQRMCCMTQAGFTALVMGFTGKKAVSLRERFIVAFERMAAELNRLKTQRTAPEWQAARLETKHDFRNVSDMLQEVRADAGKATKPHIFINESKLLRFALTGSESEKWERDNLSRDDLRLLGKVERLDMRLIARDVPFRDRKAACRTLVMQERGLLLKGAQP